MSFAVYSIILICTVYVESAESQEERSKRIILHSEGDVLTVLRETQAEIDAMNATFTSILAQQKATFTGMYAMTICLSRLYDCDNMGFK